MALDSTVSFSQTLVIGILLLLIALLIAASKLNVNRPQPQASLVASALGTNSVSLWNLLSCAGCVERISGGCISPSGSIADNSAILAQKLGASRTSMHARAAISRPTSSASVSMSRLIRAEVTDLIVLLLLYDIPCHLTSNVGCVCSKKEMMFGAFQVWRKLKK